MVIDGLTSIAFIIGLLSAVSMLNSDALTRRESLIIGLFIVSSFAFDYFNSHNFRLEWLTQLIVAACLLLPMIVFLIVSNERFKKSEAEKVIVLQILQQFIKDIDTSTVHVEMKNGNPQFISFPIDTTYKDEITSALIQKLQKIYPTMTWDGNTHMDEFEVRIEGYPPAPWPATYPGSEFRSWQWIPLGLNHLGEVGWNLGAKNPGRSSYLYDGKETAETIESASAPQGLILGSTGGGKAISLDQSVLVRKS